MSHSPDDLPEDATFGDLDAAYVQSVVKLNQMLDRGVSWSGHEANCCFLNTGTGSFANVSAITGLDFLDDGRGLALLDWDGDGDLDAWTSNRTAPMLRFVRNDTPEGKHFLMVRLQGVDCNRDAIGARVVVQLGGDSPAMLTRTVRAGEGFLGQSSKWLHFGLGDSSVVAQLTVHWPNGEPEVFSSIDVDRRYRIRQGTGRASEQPSARRNYDLAAKPTKLPPQTVKGRALLTSRLPVPSLKLETYDGRKLDATSSQRGPVLLNIWASWCRPCLVELREFSEREADLRAAGLSVYAANVDGLGDTRGTEIENHRAILQRFSYPFEAGAATAGLAAKLESIANFVYGPNRPLPVPTSFLIDSSGRLAAIYKGPVNVEQLLTDVATLSLPDSALVEAALPFKGRWIGQPPRFRPIGLAAEIAESGIDADLLDYLSRQASLLSRDSGYTKFAAEVARKLMIKERYVEAAGHLRSATQWAPKDAELWGQFGEVQLQFDDGGAAEASFRNALDLDENHVVANFQLGNLLQRRGELENAARSYVRAVAGKPTFADAHYQLAAVRFQLGQTNEAVRHMERFIELRPDDISARTNLGGMLAALGRLADAQRHLQVAVDAEPDNSMARNNLGRVLQDQGKETEAITQFKIAMRAPQSAVAAAMNLARLLATSTDDEVRDAQNAIKVAEKLAAVTNGNRADVLDVLATALAAADRYDEALETSAKALRVAKRQGDAGLIARVAKNLEELTQRATKASQNLDRRE